MLRFNKKDVICSILLFLWILFFISFFCKQIKSMNSLIGLYNYSEDEKYEIIDNGFYKFMKLCRELIPKDSGIIFEVFPKEPLLYSRDWRLKEYFVQKCTYYLFPRKVYRLEYFKDKKSDYKIVYNPQLKDFHLYHKDKLILYVTD